MLVLLTDTPGLFTADPRLDEGASLIEEIVEVDAALEAVAGGTGTARGSGGMASKLAAAKIAAWSGVRAVIAGADVPDVIVDAIEGRAVGTAVRPKPQRLPSRKLWIAFARDAAGRIVVDDGARRALCADNRSLLPAGVREVEGAFDVDDAVEIVGADGAPFAKGLVRYSAAVAARRWRAATPPSSARASPTRWSTATTSSCCPEPRPLGRAHGRRFATARGSAPPPSVCARGLRPARTAGPLLRAAVPSVTLTRNSSPTDGGRVLGRGLRRPARSGRR